MSMTVWELANISGVKIETVQRSLALVPGVKDGEIPDGTRWKYNIRNSKLKNREDRMYTLLKATDEFKYIDANMLRMDRISFESMIEELKKHNLLRSNGTNNPYGANAYDTTIEYSRMKEFSKRKLMNNIATYVGSVIGSATRVYNDI